MTLFVQKFQPKKLIKICATNKPVAATDSLYTFYIFLLFHLQNCRHAVFEYKHFFGFSRNFIFSKQKNRNKSNNKPYFIATLASARAISPWNLCVCFFFAFSDLRFYRLWTDAPPRSDEDELLAWPTNITKTKTEKFAKERRVKERYKQLVFCACRKK